MANHGGRRTAEPDNSSLILGILIGMVLGLVIAGGVAWHISTRPHKFNSDKDGHIASSSQTTPAQSHKNEPAKPAPDPSSSAEGKQKFTFYKILTEKDSATPSTTGTPSPAATSVKADNAVAYLLQAGSFAKSDDAENLKAKLALLGLEARVQEADVPGFGTRYRVQLGPYRSTDEINHAKATLKQNGITEPAQFRAR